MYTWKEQNIRKIKKYSKRGPIQRKVAKVALYSIIFLSGLGKWFAGNVKKMISLATLGLFFVGSCSFALPMIIESNEVDEPLRVAQVSVESSNEEIEAILAGEEDALLDDEDVTYGDSYEAFEDDSADVALYSAEDILTDEVLNESHLSSETDAKEEISEEIVLLSDLDPDDWRLILINKQHPVPDDYSFTLGTIQGSMQCDERILDDLFLMLLAAQEDGETLYIASPYRDYNRQTVLFDRKITAYISKGLTYAEAYSVASTQVTAPGASEHQIGLALDIVCNYHTRLNHAFGETNAGIWLVENSYKYGFILRYPEGSGDITGIFYEPWHFRYVGVEAATYIKQNGITLEELTDQLSSIN